MARALVRRALSLAAAASSPAKPSFSTAVAPLRSPMDDRLLRLLRSEINYISERRPPYPVSSHPNEPIPHLSSLCVCVCVCVCLL
jgi:hypothetical protein